MSNFVITLIVLLIVVVIIWYLPKIQIKKLNISTKEEKFKIESEARKTIAQILGGLFFFFTVYLSLNQYELSKQEKHTDLFSKAILLLSDVKIEKRIVGIYALERLAKESKEYHWNIIELLCTYVREKSPNINYKIIDDKLKKCKIDDIPPSYTASLNKNKIECFCSDLHNTNSEAVPIDKDIQAIITVIGRRNVEYEDDNQILDLSFSNLQKADFKNTNFSRTNFLGSNLSNTNFVNSDLQNCNFRRAYILKALFYNCTFKSTNFLKAILSNTKFIGCKILNDNISFYGACLEGSEFHDIKFQSVNFSFAYLKNNTFFRVHIIDKIQSNGSYIEGIEYDECSPSPLFAK